MPSTVVPTAPLSAPVPATDKQAPSGMPTTPPAFATTDNSILSSTSNYPPSTTIPSEYPRSDSEAPARPSLATFTTVSRSSDELEPTPTTDVLPSPPMSDTTLGATQVALCRISADDSRRFHWSLTAWVVCLLGLSGRPQRSTMLQTIEFAMSGSIDGWTLSDANVAKVRSTPQHTSHNPCKVPRFEFGLRP
jgi:hypothetical protein